MFPVFPRVGYPIYEYLASDSLYTKNQERRNSGNTTSNQEVNRGTQWEPVVEQCGALEFVRRQLKEEAIGGDRGTLAVQR